MKNILDNDKVIKDLNASIQPISLEKNISAVHQGINITKKKPLSLEKNNLQAPVALVKEQKVAEVEELEKPIRNQATNNETSENIKTEKSGIVKLFSLIFFILKWFCIVFVAIAVIIIFVVIVDKNKSTSSDPAQIETPVSIEPQQVSVAPPVQPIAPTENTSQIQQEREELAKYKAKDVFNDANKQIDIIWNATTQKIRDAILPEQDEWLKKRERDCGLKASSEEPDNSVLQETIKFSCMTAMTDQRAEELKQEIASLQRFDNNAQTSTRAEPVSVDKPVENTNSANAITTDQKSTDRYQVKNSLVTDTKTGLMWMRCSLGQNWDGSTCQGDAARYTWKKAMSFTNNFSYAGYSDWRLPSVQELKTLVYCSSGQPVKWNEFIGETEYDGCNGQYNSPTVIQDVFPTTPATWSWSSSPNDADKDRAWAVNFGKGSAPRNANKDGTIPVRFVRNEKTTASSSSTATPLENISQSRSNQKIPQKEAAPVNAEQHIQKMLQGAMTNDGISIQASRQYLENLPKPTKGDRKAAREINEEALKLIQSQQYDQAVPLLAKASQTDPSDVEILNNYGFVLMMSNNPNQAETVLIKTLIMKPDRSSAWSNLGFAFALQGKKDMAVASYLNTYLFSKNPEKTLQFFKDKLAQENNPTIKNALTRAVDKIITGKN